MIKQTIFNFISKIVLIFISLSTIYNANAHQRLECEVFNYADRYKQKDAIIKHLHDYGFIAFIGVPKYIHAYKDYVQAGRQFISLDESEKAKCSPEDNNQRG